ncbi:MAG: glycosyltransferase family 2 protein [Thermoanaerobaculia bacterium]
MAEPIAPEAIAETHQPRFRTEIHADLEVSVVIPCLDEEDTVGICVAEALRVMRASGIRGEVIVADNGSTDGSQDVAVAAGARVVAVERRGYGNALMGGIERARGDLVVMGDADDSYDFGEIPKFVEALREGADLAQGCRLPSGGGRILPGAMPPLHRWLGNPMFSGLARRMFSVPVHDINCGLRAFRRDLYRSLDLRCTGMEFATEMVIKSRLYGARIVEVPTVLHPDGRRGRAPHLRTVRDGWRTLRFYLLYSPRWLFLYPSVALILFGLIGYALAYPAVRIGPATLGVHTLLVSSLAILIGHQALLFAIASKTFAIAEGLHPPDPHLDRFFRLMNLETGILVSVMTLAAGIGLLALSVDQWISVGFGPLDYSRTMRWVIPGVTLTALGFQTLLWSFFVSVLGLRRK